MFCNIVIKNKTQYTNSNNTNKYIYYIGKKYNNWTIIGISNRPRKCGVEVICKCNCGTERIIQLNALIRNKTKSCGCLNKVTYNTKDSLYKIYLHMKGRCYCKTDKKYKNYGERGIKICNDWLQDYNNFLSWSLKHGYKPGLTIERIDVNGNYEPNNCKFITISEQSKNKTTSHYYKYYNKVYSLKELSNIFTHSYKYLYREIVVNKNLERFNLKESNYLEYINQYEKKSSNG